ncbi:MFS transporter [Salinisphaera sp. RV14]|uniref:MFS transporter n=1 Tax=unclassified Salinisphaera TaxID=2649847 RepID=UPI003F863D58
MSRLFSDQPGDDGLPGAERRLAVLVLIIGTLMAVLDGSIVNIALPTIADELHASASTTIWVANAFRLISAMGLISFAALGDVIGYRGVYLFGLVVFTLASLGCALCDAMVPLIALRGLQGFGAAATLSVGPALYRTIFPKRLLGSAIGLSALVVASGMAAGPSIGGGILAVLGWPWLFAINVPLGLISYLIARHALPREGGRGGRFDIVGAVLSSISLGALVLAVDGLSGQGASAWAAPLFTLSVVAGVLFIVWQRRVAHPLLPLDIFRSRRFSMAALTSFTAFTAQGITFIALPFLFQSIQGYSPLMSALLFSPWPIIVIAAGPIAGRLSDRFNPTPISTVGLVVFMLGMVSLALLGPAASVADIVWRTALCGLGYGFFQAPNNHELLGSVPRERSGSASGILASARTFGQSLGAAFVAIVLARAAEQLAPGAVAMTVAPVHLALWIGVGIGLSAIGISAARISMHRAG